MAALKKLPNQNKTKKCRFRPLMFIYSLSVGLVVFAGYNSISLSSRARSNEAEPVISLLEMKRSDFAVHHSKNDDFSKKDTAVVSGEYELPPGFQAVLERAKKFQQHCDEQILVSSDIKMQNEIDLPPFGIVNDLESYLPESPEEANDWKCEVPPPTECHIERFSTIFLGYNPDRLQGVKRQLQRMLSDPGFKDMVEEFILVWNNPKPLNESGKVGELLYEWSSSDVNPFDKSEPNRFRLFLPIELGFSSSLMNRYHPMIKPKSKALLYYDDDGPFYEYRAIKSNLELWKRNSDIQTGAMARAFTLSKRQEEEKLSILGGIDELDDRKFVSHCRQKGDEISYDYRFFENFHANMVLPSGSMIHRNYLCFIWHPALRKFRKFVFDHIVHPDDMGVSAIVSHVSGRAPKPYSRRVPDPEKKRRRLTAVNETSPEGMWRTKDWGKLRSIALNSVMSYFGGINSGSFGWCHNTEYHTKHGKRHICNPEMARHGTLPWMIKGGFGHDICSAN
mmetsp:Transcript_23409/g.34556  ORF Transcript_23409/g.34556 Transcript_23409/m.34556 type:complete len:507 (-) Transcript_23409:238-1758(-)